MILQVFYIMSLRLLATTAVTTSQVRQCEADPTAEDDFGTATDAGAP